MCIPFRSALHSSVAAVYVNTVRIANPAGGIGSRFCIYLLALFF